MYTDLTLTIAGRTIAAGQGRTSEPVYNPRTGPVLLDVPVVPFARVDEAINIANLVTARLAGYAFTKGVAH